MSSESSDTDNTLYSFTGALTGVIYPSQVWLFYYLWRIKDQRMQITNVSNKDSETRVLLEF